MQKSYTDGSEENQQAWNLESKKKHVPSIENSKVIKDMKIYKVPIIRVSERRQGTIRKDAVITLYMQ